MRSNESALLYSTKSTTVMQHQLACVLRVSMKNPIRWPHLLGAILEQKRFCTDETVTSDAGSSSPSVWDMRVPRYCPSTAGILNIFHLLFNNSSFNFFNLLLIVILRPWPGCRDRVPVVLNRPIIFHKFVTLIGPFRNFNGRNSRRSALLFSFH